MSDYDITPKGAQVKCFSCNYTVIQVGQEVLAYYPEYIVLLQEGGYIHVKNGNVVELIEDKKPRYPEEFSIPCIDKWGGVVENSEALKGRCMFGFDYYYAHEKKPAREVE